MSCEHLHSVSTFSDANFTWCLFIYRYIFYITHFNVHVIQLNLSETGLFDNSVDVNDNHKWLIRNLIIKFFVLDLWLGFFGSNEWKFLWWKHRYSLHDGNFVLELATSLENRPINFNFNHTAAIGSLVTSVARIRLINEWLNIKRYINDKLRLNFCVDMVFFHQSIILIQSICIGRK